LSSSWTLFEKDEDIRQITSVIPNTPRKKRNRPEPLGVGMRELLVSLKFIVVLLSIRPPCTGWGWVQRETPDPLLEMILCPREIRMYVVLPFLYCEWNRNIERYILDLNGVGLWHIRSLNCLPLADVDIWRALELEPDRVVDFF
jgi:hypothetical protein